MKKLLTVALLFGFMIMVAGPVQATYIDDDSNPAGELDLYKIYAEIFNDYTSYSSSADLFAAHGVADADDDWWSNLGSGVVKVTVRYAGYGQTLGIEDEDGNYYDLVKNIPGGTSSHSVKIINYVAIEKDFVFVEKLSKSGVGPWYSNNRDLSFDHFVAIDVTKKYNENLNKFGVNAEQAWLIAFEDLPDGGDHDYNDLVAVVADVSPVITFAEEISFDAVPGAGSVALEWTAVSEENVLGYNILRSQGNDGVFEQINTSLIQAKGNIEITVDYSFSDEDVKNGKLYTYKLIEVENDGAVKLHEQVRAVPRLIYKFFK